MSPSETEIAIKFLMAKLPEHDLAALDAQLAGGAQDSSLAMDAASVERRKWLEHDPRTRIAIRKSKFDRLAQDSAGQKGFAERFPDVARVRSL